jgi:hypothetical protein
MKESRISNLVVNQQEAYELACRKREESNLSRCYLELRAELVKIAAAKWSGRSDLVGAAFEMQKIAQKAIRKTL